MGEGIQLVSETGSEKPRMCIDVCVWVFLYVCVLMYTCGWVSMCIYECVYVCECAYERAYV
jgi:hypothetical protein